MPFVRWGTGAGLLLVATVPLAADALRSIPRLRWTAVVLLVLLAVPMLVWFRSGDTTRGGPHWNPGLDTARMLCRAAPSSTVSVPSFPGGWAVAVPCDDVG